MRGRKPKPTEILKLEGSLRPARHADRAFEPPAPGALMDPPAWMSQSMQDGWRYALEHAPLGVLAKIDRAMLTIWVTAEDLHRQALAKVEAGGLIVRSPVKGEPIQNPYLAIVNKQAMIMIKAGAELGFSPTARPRLGKPHGDGAGDRNNRFANLGPKHEPGERSLN